MFLREQTEESGANSNLQGMAGGSVESKVLADGMTMAELSLVVGVGLGGGGGS